jgi:hypothetical protein
MFNIILGSGFELTRIFIGDTMKKMIKLLTVDGKVVKVMLDNWGAGMDRLHRRWTLQAEGWHCVDNGEIAQGLESLDSHPMKLWAGRR